MPRQKSSYDHGIETKRVYRFEYGYFRYHYFSKPRSMKYLKNEAKYLWNVLKIKKPMPNIKAGRGTAFGGKLYSYYSEKEGIVMSRNQRDIVTLIHELAHAIGHDHHDHQFVDQIFKMYKLYDIDTKALAQARIISRLP